MLDVSNRGVAVLRVDRQRGVGPHLVERLDMSLPVNLPTPSPALKLAHCSWSWSATAVLQHQRQQRRWLGLGAATEPSGTGDQADQRPAAPELNSTCVNTFRFVSEQPPYSILVHGSSPRGHLGDCGGLVAVLDQPGHHLVEAPT